MRYRKLDLNLLVALEALLTEQSVTKAAEKLHMTQPAMSGALARLRDRFDDALLVQFGRRLKLTPRAEALVEPIHDIMLRIDSTVDVAPDFEPAKSTRHFVMVASDYVILVFLSDVLGKVHLQAPNMTFEFRQSRLTALQELEAGEIDFIIGPAIDVLPEHPHEILFEDKHSIVAWENNQEIGQSISLDEYTALGHVIFEDRQTHSAPAFDRWFLKEFGDARRIEYIAQNFSLLPHMVVGTDLIATLPSRLARNFAKNLPIRLLEPPLDPPPLTEVLQWNRYRDQDPAGQWLRQMILEYAATFPPAENCE